MCGVRTLQPQSPGRRHATPSRDGSASPTMPRPHQFHGGAAGSADAPGQQFQPPSPSKLLPEVDIPSYMQKTLIFVVDMSAAELVDDEPKDLDEVREDIVDALGITSSSPAGGAGAAAAAGADQQQDFQVIFAGYDGLERRHIDDGQGLADFFAQFPVDSEAAAANGDTEMRDSGKDSAFDARLRQGLQDAAAAGERRAAERCKTAGLLAGSETSDAQNQRRAKGNDEKERFIEEVLRETRISRSELICKNG